MICLSEANDRDVRDREAKDSGKRMRSFKKTAIIQAVLAVINRNNLLEEEK